MNEKIEKEWMQGDRSCRGKAVGYRQFKTDLDEHSCLEDVVLKIDIPMQQRNQEFTEGKNRGIFGLEFLEDVFLENDGFWRYVVAMNYIPIALRGQKKSSPREFNL